MRLSVSPLLLLLATGLLSAQTSPVAQQHPYTTKDWIATRSAYPLDVSPDAQRYYPRLLTARTPVEASRSIGSAIQMAAKHTS